MSGDLLDLAEAQRRLLALAPEMPLETRDVGEANSHFLASPVEALVGRPEAATSAMDGFAVRYADGAGPWRVIGESAAGHPYGSAVGTNEAVRIATGGLLPRASDTVIIQEDCRGEDDRLSLTAALPPRGANVRPAGMDFSCGEPLLPAGARLSPAGIALALAAGHAQVSVRRAPTVALLDTGDELVAAGAARSPGQIAASNAAMLAAMLAALPCVVRRLAPAADELAALTAALRACQDADIVVTTGGASVGDHDLVRPALAATGADLAFWRVAIKPGKPLLVATRPRPDGQRQLILGLPGNPASAFVTGFLFLLPLVRAALGAAEPLPPTVPTHLAAPVPATAGRAEFLRARWDGREAAPLVLQDSSALRPLAQANALIVRPPRAEALPAGASIAIHLLDNGGIA